MVMEMEAGTGRKLWGEFIVTFNQLRALLTQFITGDELSQASVASEPASSQQTEMLAPAKSGQSVAPLEPRPTRSLRPRPEPTHAPLEPRATRSRNKKDRSSTEDKEKEATSAVPVPVVAVTVDKENTPAPIQTQVVSGASDLPAKDDEREAIRKRLDELARMEEELEREVRALIGH